MVKRTMLHLASLVGRSDGSTYADCAACGLPAYCDRSPGSDDALHVGHVVSAANGGAKCPCNVLALCKRCNVDDMRDADLLTVCTPHYDPRGLWDGVLMAPLPKATSGSRRHLWQAPSA